MLHVMSCMTHLVPGAGIVIVPVDVDTARNVGALLLQSNQQVHGLTVEP